MVLTDQPLKEVFQKMATSGRMVKWSIELSEFSMEFQLERKLRPWPTLSLNVHSQDEQTKKSMPIKVKEKLLKR